MRLAARVVRAMTCTFGGGLKVVTKSCGSGTSSSVILVGPNSSSQSRTDRLWILVRGRGGARRQFVAVSQGAKSVVTPTTTTTLPPKAVNVCSGPCSFAFPQASLSGVVSVAMNSVTQAVACPDAGFCDATSSQQVDDVNVTVCAGPSGDTDVAGQIYNFSLALADGTQASTDFVTFDGNVQTALGNYGAVAPNQCVTGDVFVDAPITVPWVSLNYSYTSANFTTQTVYSWKA